MKCERCAYCGREVKSFYYCSYVNDGGQTYESCFCVCEDCRGEIEKLGRVTLWRPQGQHEED